MEFMTMIKYYEYSCIYFIDILYFEGLMRYKKEFIDAIKIRFLAPKNETQIYSYKKKYQYWIGYMKIMNRKVKK